MQDLASVSDVDLLSLVSKFASELKQHGLRGAEKPTASLEQVMEEIRNRSNGFELPTSLTPTLLVQAQNILAQSTRPARLTDISNNREGASLGR